MAKQPDREETQAKILHLLSIFPVLTPTMLQAGLGPYVKPSTWRPALEDLIVTDQVMESQHSCRMPSGRYNTYTLILLPTTSLSYLDALEAKAS